MDYVNLQKSEGIATLVLEPGEGERHQWRGGGANEAAAPSPLKVDPEVRAIILTGSGKFFSFGFDIPEFLSFSREQFKNYLQHFTGLYTYPIPLSQACGGGAQRSRHRRADACWLWLAISA